jgi:hypothetical protein
VIRSAWTAATAVVVAAVLGMTTGGCGAKVWSFDGDGGSDGSTEEAASPSRCTSDRDCGLPGLHCYPPTGECVACIDDSQCATPGFPSCDPALHECVHCGTSSDNCPTDSFCEPTSHACVPTCADGGPCPLGLCDYVRGICTQCMSPRDCSTATTGHVCDYFSGNCVECVYDEQCMPPTGRCDRATNKCVGCVTSEDCGSGRLCDPVMHTCRYRWDQ